MFRQKISLLILLLVLPAFACQVSGGDEVTAEPAPTAEISTEDPTDEPPAPTAEPVATDEPAATAEPITPATFGPIACINKKL